MTTKTTEEQWRREFDKIHLKYFRYWQSTPKWVTDDIYNDFERIISSLLLSQKEALMRKAIACVPEKKGESVVYLHKSISPVDGFNDCREQTLQKLGEIE